MPAIHRVFIRATGLFLLMNLLIHPGCTNKENKEPAPITDPITRQPPPPFSPDSAYAYVAKQVAFGPRVPGTAAHEACGDWLVQTLSGWADEVSEQKTTVKAWDGKTLPVRNITARFNPEHPRRVLLCAHWDTRPIADEDTERQSEPISGANDGGSGVAVLLELARQFHRSDPGIGIDMVLFDTEDYGNPKVEDSYCLGSQYWATQARKTGYTAEFGILLDMVGAEGAVFYREGISMHYAPDVVERVWRAAATAGHRSYFVYNQEPFPPLTDDHLYVNQIAGIPTIDIIQYDRESPKGFGEFWHTHRDDMPIISLQTLRAVGETLGVVLREEGATVQ